jgi:hypothetical protein
MRRVSWEAVREKEERLKAEVYRVAESARGLTSLDAKGNLPLAYVYGDDLPPPALHEPRFSFG